MLLPATQRKSLTSECEKLNANKKNEAKKKQQN